MKKFEEVFGMMKKISIFFLALILMFSMAGCGAESDPQTSGPADRGSNPECLPEGMHVF